MTDLVDFLGSKVIPTSWLKIQVFKEKDNGDIQSVQNITTRELDLSQVLRLRNQLVFAAKDFGSDQILPPPHRLHQNPKIWKNNFGRCQPSQQNDLCDSAAIQCGQLREFLCSNPIVREEEGRGKIFKNFPCEKKTRRIFIFAWLYEFCIR